MPDNDLQISFGADTAGLVSGANVARSAIQSVVSDVATLKVTLSGLESAIATAFKSVDVASDSLGGAVGGLADLASQTTAAMILTYQGLLNAMVPIGAEITAVFQRSSADQMSANKEAAEAEIADQQAVLQQFQTGMNGLVSNFSSGLLKMAEGSKSFGQVMASVGQQILNDMLRVVDKMVDEWLFGVARNVLASTQGQTLLDALGMKSLAQAISVDQAKASAARAAATQQAAASQSGAAASAAAEGTAASASIGTSAAKAAAAVYGDIATSFGPAGPFVAPVFAGAALAAVLDFKGLINSAEGGFDIPSGLNPLTQLHQQEMVLPARLANPMRAMLDNFSANQNSPGATNDRFAGGETHHHYNISALDAGSFRNFLRGRTDDLSTILQEMGRRGQKTG